jgi:hypothetical protein
MKVINNILPQDVFDTLQAKVFSVQFPWYHVSTAHEGGQDPFSYSWSHLCFEDRKIYHDIFYEAGAALDMMLANTGHVLDELYRIRLGCITISKDLVVHDAHVDHLFPHQVGLLYLNDADGDTILYNEQYDFTKPDVRTTPLLTEAMRIEPVANRFLTFDGSHFHSSSTPSEVARRVNINYTYSIK